MHVAGPLNPADLPTRSSATADDVRGESVWQTGPAYLYLPKEQWPFSRNFLDHIPEQELRVSKAVFNNTYVESWQCILGPKLSALAFQVMDKSNCLSNCHGTIAQMSL